MRSGYRCSVVLLLCCTLTFVAFSFPALGQKAPASAERKTASRDQIRWAAAHPTAR